MLAAAPLLFAAAAIAAGSTTPPQAARDGLALRNAGFEAAAPAATNIEGWQLTVHSTPTAYGMALDTKFAHGGKASARLWRSGKEPWGMVHQTLPPGIYAGGTLEFSAWLRTDAASGAILVLRTLANGTVDRYVFMDPPIAGTHAWQRYSVRLAIAPGPHVVDVGAMLQGDGTLWLDDATLVMLRR
ncbi:MAG: hypothetical protein ABI190_11360 [Casimicrobiaceae bacterium]